MFTVNPFWISRRWFKRLRITTLIEQSIRGNWLIVVPVEPNKVVLRFTSPDHIYIYIKFKLHHCFYVWPLKPTSPWVCPQLYTWQHHGWIVRQSICPCWGKKLRLCSSTFALFGAIWLTISTNRSTNSMFTYHFSVPVSGSTEKMLECSLTGEAGQLHGRLFGYVFDREEPTFGQSYFKQPTIPGAWAIGGPVVSAWGLSEKLEEEQWYVINGHCPWILPCLPFFLEGY